MGCFKDLDWLLFTDWNWDWGSVPQYLGLLLASIVGYFTVRGVRIAQNSLAHTREAYEEDIRLRTYAQARLVYGEIVEDATLREKHLREFEHNDINIKVINFPDIGGPDPVEEVGRDTFVINLRATVEARIFVIRIHNNSDELISKVTAALHDGESVLIAGDVVPVLLGPNEHRDYVIANPAIEGYNPTEVTVTFTDATGQGWVRRGARPVEPFPPPDKDSKRTKFRDPAKTLRRLRR